MTEKEKKHLMALADSSGVIPVRIFRRGDVYSLLYKTPNGEGEVLATNKAILRMLNRHRWGF